MFLPPVVSTPQVPRKMGSPMHEESVFYKYNIQNSNLLAATAAFWTFSQKFMKKAKKIHFLGLFSGNFEDKSKMQLLPQANCCLKSSTCKIHFPHA